MHPKAASEGVARGGGGSGGGAASIGQSAESGGELKRVDGTYCVQANQLQLLSTLPREPAVPLPYVITVLAAGEGTDGRVDVRGSQGVRITAGPIPLPPTTSESINGVEIIVGEGQNITIQRGLPPPIGQMIEMTPDGITIDAGSGTLTLKSLTQIKLSVAEGITTVTLGPEGVQIQGPLIKIN